MRGAITAIAVDGLASATASHRLSSRELPGGKSRPSFTSEEMATLEAQGIVTRAVGKVEEEEIQTLVFSNAGEWTKVSPCLVPPRF